MSFSAQAVIFDLDGTLLNTITDLANSANYVLVNLGLPPHQPAEYRYFVGNGIEKLIERIIPKDQPNIKEQVLCRLRQHYSKHWADTTAPYPDITTLLDHLAAQNIPFAVLSNKPEELTMANINYFFAKWSFHTVAGAVPNYPNKPNADRALAIAANLNIQPKDIIFMGDSGVDMQTANNAGMHGIGVTWGFRCKEELLENGAQALISKPMEISKYLACV